ncbi:hypothetical protein IVA94_14785 [Bradyrhizobium sp. 156]|uniref:hypothetical protein n=1 Tax=Bradyrhizobium sp. 156 TaxID=2782630 RepID=UPI001FFA86F7|nr:hypothetical protein [Bradyrhizobium sp. 156]MCK1322134.1 hypothetical protein [Bradyrhizobium sp. 156]
MSELKLRRTVIGGQRLDDDFIVLHDGRSVGRIRRAAERIGHNPGWDWTVTIPLPVPAWTHGSSDSFDEAKAAFKAALESFLEGLTEADMAHWHHIADARSRQKISR